MLKKPLILKANNSFTIVLIQLKVLLTELNLTNEKLFNGSCILSNRAAVFTV